MFAAVVDGREEYQLLPFFWKLLDDEATIEYRQAVLRDLEDGEVRRRIDRFAGGMTRMRLLRRRARETNYRAESEAWLLAAIGCYCETLMRFAAELREAAPVSAGLRALGHHLDALLATAEFRDLTAEQERVAAGLAGIEYTIEIRGDRVRVDPYDGQADYGAEIDDLFQRFRQDEEQAQTFARRGDPRMNHIEAQILDRVAKLNPEAFDDLTFFCQQHTDLVDETITRFDREVQFYLAYLDHIEPLRAAGLSFCTPRISDSKAVAANGSFDLGLATKLLGEGSPVITNDWKLTGAERIFVVSGPNQGGKTTFARSFGQLHYLARLGLSVPGTEASLFLSDRIFTHFERQEDHSDLSGKLEDDLQRARDTLTQASGRSIVVMNESFSSAALEDARLLGRRVLESLSELDLLCVYVTFVDELASLNEKTVSVTSTVDPGNRATRTFKVVRRPADGRAYALAIAEKHDLTYEKLVERISR